MLKVSVCIYNSLSCRINHITETWNNPVLQDKSHNRDIKQSCLVKYVIAHALFVSIGRYLWIPNIENSRKPVSTFCTILIICFLETDTNNWNRRNPPQLQMTFTSDLIQLFPLLFCYCYHARRAIPISCDSIVLLEVCHCDSLSNKVVVRGTVHLVIV